MDSTLIQVIGLDRQNLWVSMVFGDCAAIFAVGSRMDIRHPGVFIFVI
jgi:hypothetical protein